MTPVPRPESRHAWPYPDSARTRRMPVNSLALAAHLAMLGFELVLVPSRTRAGEFVWLAPPEARNAADKYVMTLRLMGDDRRAHTSRDQHGQPDAGQQSHVC